MCSTIYIQDFHCQPRPLPCTPGSSFYLPSCVHLDPPRSRLDWTWVGSSCEVKQVGSWRRQGETPDSDVVLTLVEEVVGGREEGHLDRKSLGLQHCSRKCSVRSRWSPWAKVICERCPCILQEWPCLHHPLYSVIAWERPMGHMASVSSGAAETSSQFHFQLQEL